MKILRKKEEGISPVIAEILMVVITVILAATLYTMISGFFSINPKPPIAGNLYIISEDSPKSFVVTLIMSSPASATPTNVYFAVNNTPANLTSLNPYTWNATVSGHNITIVFDDLDGNHLVDTGDTFQITSSYSLVGTKIVFSLPKQAAGTIYVIL